MSRLVEISRVPPNHETPLAALRAGVVPNDAFYVRCHSDVPAVDVGTWRLKVGGAVGAPRTYRLEELRSLPHVTTTVTLECAGNGRTLMDPVPPGVPWGLGAVGTARFTGVRVGDVLRRARPAPSAAAAVFTGADRGVVDGERCPYAFDLPLSRAVGDGPLLAWGMNGEPLPAAHGYPLRLVVPGAYGMASVKWLTRVDVVDAPYDGYWPGTYRYVGDPSAAEGARVGQVRVRSLILEPADGDHVRGPVVEVRGVAWSGGGEVTAVDVSVDSSSWHPARLAPAAGPHAWRGWSYRWTPPGGGRYELAVRATDAAGDRQPLAPVWNARGYGNNAVHRVGVTVEG